MTRLTKPVTRESAVTDRGRPLIVTLHPRHLEIRLKRSKRAYTIAYDAAMWYALKRDLEIERRERAARKRRRP